MKNNITPYFSHDSNARNSEKLLKVRMKYGAEGYGVYFMLLERLRDEDDYKCLVDLDIFSFDFRVDVDVIKSIIYDFNLFSFSDDGKYFYSDSLMRRMEIKDKKKEELSEIRRMAANKRWEKEKGISTPLDANALQNDAKKREDKIIKDKENIDKENKEKTDSEIKSAIFKYSDNEELRDNLCVFVKMRNDLNKPFSVNDFNLFLKQLDSYGASNADKNTLLRNSIMNKWANIYPISSSLKSNHKSNLDDYFMTSSRQTDGMSEEELKKMLGVQSIRM